MSKFFESIASHYPAKTAPKKNFNEILTELEKKDKLTVAKLRGLENEIEKKVAAEFRELVQNVTNWDPDVLQDLLDGAQRFLAMNFLQKEQPQYLLELEKKFTELVSIKEGTEHDNAANENYMHLLSLLKVEMMMIFYTNLMPLFKTGMAEKKLRERAKEARKEVLAVVEATAQHDGQSADLSLEDLKEYYGINPETQKITERLFLNFRLIRGFQRLGVNLNRTPSDAEKNEKPDEKKALLKDYFGSLAEKLAEVRTLENPEQEAQKLAAEIKRTAASVVGTGLLAENHFKAAIKLLEDELDKTSAGRLLADALYSGFKDENPLADWINAEDFTEKAKAQFDHQTEIHEKNLLALQNNPANFGMRTFSSLGDILLFGGEKLIWGVLGLNLAFSGLSPTKLLQNPVMLASLVGAYFGIKHYHPQAFTESEPKKRAEENLKNTLDNLDETSSVWNWLAVVELADLKDDGLQKILEDSKRLTFSSAVLRTALEGRKKDRDNWPDKTSNIIADTKEADLLFVVLQTCQQQEISPQDFLKNYRE